MNALTLRKPNTVVRTCNGLDMALVPPYKQRSDGVFLVFHWWARREKGGCSGGVVLLDECDGSEREWDEIAALVIVLFNLTE